MSLVFLGYRILFFMISERDLNEEVGCLLEIINAYRATYSRVLSFAISCWRKRFPIPLQVVFIVLPSSIGGTMYFTKSCHFSEMT